jgi:hypothetical protein
MNLKLVVFDLIAAGLSVVLMLLAPALVRGKQGRSGLIFFCRKLLPGAFGVCGLVMLAAALVHIVRSR